MALPAVLWRLRGACQDVREVGANPSERRAALDDLKRDVQVAEAVFSSALARTDTSKSDYFASYPMVQTLEAPEVPQKPSAPLPLLAVAGGIAATILIIAALVLTWIRTALLQRILKSD